MRSIRGGEDLTARARIRDAALQVIGRQGFRGATVRAIAEAAGVSPGLVIHHFGSKEGLRQACDDHAMRILTEAIEEMQQRGPAGAVAQMDRHPDLVPISQYFVRTLLDGGPTAQTLFDRVVEDTEKWLVARVSAGEVRPTDNEHARAQLLVTTSFGLQILARYLAPGAADGDEGVAMVDVVTGPAVELYTYGLFTTPDYLDAVREGMKR